ncbi:MAG: hypothetical protein KC636_22275, partial [Myxococcales bacterium]|nr:hypothetical protein [Myxococcales bacterium]
LAGPYRDLDEYCEQLRAQSQAELDPEATPDHCDDAALVRMASAREGPIDRAELLRVANDWAGSAGHACHLALRRAGEAAPPAWFVLAGEGRCDGVIGPAHTVTTELLEFDWPPGQEGRVFVVLVKERHARDEVATVDPRAQPRFARQEHANEFLQVCAPVDDALRCSPPLLLACSTIAGETVRARWRVAADGVVIEGDPAAFDDCDLAPEFRPGRVALTAP